MGEARQQDVTDRKLVIFDFDGTLANTIPGIVSTARTVLLGFGLAEEDLGDLRRLVGPPFPQAFSLVYGLSEADAAEVTRRYRQIYDGLGPESWPAFPGMPQLLADLKAAGRLLAVASSKRHQLLQRCVRGAGIYDLFDLVRGKDQDTGGLTKGQLVADEVRQLGLTPADALMVGDRHFDVEAAREAGLPCVGVYYGETAPEGELEEAGACAIAHTMDELRACLLG